MNAISVMVSEVEPYEAINMFKLLYVYILKCADNSYYTGVTNNPNERLIRQNEGYNKDTYTFSRRPVELVYLESFWNFHDAIAWEKQIKRWTRKKKEALMANNWDKLKELAQCKNQTSHKNHPGVSSFGFVYLQRTFATKTLRHKEYNLVSLRLSGNYY